MPSPDDFLFVVYDLRIPYDPVERTARHQHPTPPVPSDPTMPAGASPER